MEIRDAISVTTAFQPSDATLKRHYISLAEYPPLRDVKGPVVFAITLNNKSHLSFKSQDYHFKYQSNKLSRLISSNFYRSFPCFKYNNECSCSRSIRTLIETFSERISANLLQLYQT